MQFKDGIEHLKSYYPLVNIPKPQIFGLQAVYQANFQGELYCLKECITKNKLKKSLLSSVNLNKKTYPMKLMNNQRSSFNNYQKEKPSNGQTFFLLLLLQLWIYQKICQFIIQTNDILFNNALNIHTLNSNTLIIHLQFVKSPLIGLSMILNLRNKP